LTGCLSSEAGSCLVCDYDWRRVYNEELEIYECESTCLVDSLLWDAYIIYDECGYELTYDNENCYYCQVGSGRSAGWDEYCLECNHSTGTCLQCMPGDSDGYTYVVGEEGYCVEESCPNHCKTCNYNIDTDALECLECGYGYTVDMTTYPFECVKTDCSCGEFYNQTIKDC